MTGAAEPATKGARREALLAEAARQLNAKGVSQTALAELADTLNISRAALYHYVDDRQDLVFQCYRRSCEKLAQHLNRSTRGAAGALGALEAFVSMTLAPDEQEFAAISEIGLLNAEQHDTIVGLYLGIVAHLASVIDQGVRDGSVRPCDSTVVAHIILSMVFWIQIAKRWSIAIATVPRALTVETLIAVIKGGISSRRAVPVPRFDLSALLPSGAGVFDRAFMTRTRRDALIKAAANLFNRKGIDATSMEEIATEAGATKRAILHHFGDKAGLVSACYHRAYELFIYVAVEAERHPGPRDEALAGAWSALSEANFRDDLRHLTPLVGFDSLPPDAQASINALSTDLSMHYINMLAAGRRDGSLGDFDDGAFLFSVSGAFTWLTKNIVDLDEARRAVVHQEITNLIMIGLSSAP